MGSRGSQACNRTPLVPEPAHSQSTDCRHPKEEAFHSVTFWKNSPKRVSESVLNVTRCHRATCLLFMWGRCSSPCHLPHGRVRVRVRVRRPCPGVPDRLLQQFGPMLSWMPSGCCIAAWHQPSCPCPAVSWCDCLGQHGLGFALDTAPLASFLLLFLDQSPD